MFTGRKGKTVEVNEAELLALISEKLGLPESNIEIVAENYRFGDVVVSITMNNLEEFPNGFKDWFRNEMEKFDTVVDVDFGRYAIEGGEYMEVWLDGKLFDEREYGR